MSADRRWGVGVVVPAHNEAERIVTALGAVLASVEDAVASGAVDPRAVCVVAVADACRDATAELARGVFAADGRGRGRVVYCRARNVGAARRRGCEAALRRVGRRDPARVWLANTDADSRVPVDWLRRHLAQAERGVAAVAGVVRVDSFADHPPQAARHFARHYAVASDAAHPHVHGANLGVRADAYRAAGGWPELALAEDHCLWNRLRRDYPVSAAADSWVVTSGRAEGRAAGGFADTLAALAAAPQPEAA